MSALPKGIVRIALTGLALMLPGSVLAQDPEREGETRVRVTSGRSWIGALERATADSLYVRVDGSGDRLAFDRTAIERLEISDGRRAPRTGFAVGAIAGMVVGAVVAKLYRSEQCRRDPSGTEYEVFDRAACHLEGALEYVLFPGLAGYVGGGTGALLHRGEEWRTLAPRTPPSPGPALSFGMRVELPR